MTNGKMRLSELLQLQVSDSLVCWIRHDHRISANAKRSHKVRKQRAAAIHAREHDNTDPVR